MGKKCKWCGCDNSFPLNKYCKECHYNPEINVKLSTKVQQSTIQRSAVKKISDKRRKRLNEWWWEVPVFMKVYDYYKHRCVLTWKYVEPTEPDWLPPSYCFPHLLSKWMYAHLRTFRSNVVLVSSLELHWIVDKIINDLKKEIWNQELESTILKWENLAPRIKEIYEKKYS